MNRIDVEYCVFILGICGCVLLATELLAIRSKSTYDQCDESDLLKFP